MGILYSHIVFQPPVPPTYADDDGSITFRRIRSAHAESEDEDEGVTTTDASIDGSNLAADYVHHPVFYLQTSRGNTIAASFFHHPRSHFTILFSHGNGEDLGVTASYALQLSNTLNTSVLCYDYSGYGISTGKASETNCYADIRAAYSYLVRHRRIAPDRILLFGRSLGSGPTIDLAATLGPDLGGVVLIAPLLSCVRVVFNSVPTTPNFDMFANIDKIHRVHVPIFCVHGMVDNVVPFSHGLQLTRRARFPLEPLWIRDASHNNLESSRFQYEVFLRYMTVLQEFRRWSPPRLHLHQQSPHSEALRRVSSKGLGRVASCFGPRMLQPRAERQSSAAHHADEELPALKRSSSRAKNRHNGRKRNAARASSSYANLPNLLMPSRSARQLHEEELRALWGACDDSGNKLAKRSSDSDLVAKSHRRRHSEKNGSRQLRGYVS
ncbi:unnamed protein product [Agarophyton chilense]|eukprot:gb/GEZJ01005405.1/.p1 GENE.gb/GEZJ01005405.1/~~gb/GEZJ01005405.1/.p1  ORF type:complete len:452 (-),score=62.48 gb/GEZJ01005405.1/:1633-2949(-)